MNDLTSGLICVEQYLIEAEFDDGAAVVHAAIAEIEALRAAAVGEGHVVVPRLFDMDASERAWGFWMTRGHGHQSFVMCINAYVEAASAGVAAGDSTDG